MLSCHDFVCYLNGAGIVALDFSFAQHVHFLFAPLLEPVCQPFLMGQVCFMVLFDSILYVPSTIFQL